MKKETMKRIIKYIPFANIVIMLSYLYSAISAKQYKYYLKYLIYIIIIHLIPGIVASAEPVLQNTVLDGLASIICYYIAPLVCCVIGERMNEGVGTAKME